MRKRSPANRAASSPPVPPRISSVTFLLSSGSAGMSRSLISSSNSGMRFSFTAISSRAISFISGSSSIESISFASSKPFTALMYSCRAFMMSSRFLYSFVSCTYRFWSAMTFGSVMRVDTSSNRGTNPSNFSSIVFSVAIVSLFWVQSYEKTSIHHVLCSVILDNVLERQHIHLWYSIRHLI